MDLHIREMTPEDIDFATGCTCSVGWFSENREAFECFLAADPHGCFVATVGSQKAGICVATRYQRHGFIGELVITGEMRIHGIGRPLFTHALNYLTGHGIENIFLDGALNAVPFYENMGFRKICRSLRFKGKMREKKHDVVRRLRPEDMDSLCLKDENAFGDDRGFFLRFRLTRHPELCFVQEIDGETAGYIMARPGRGLLAVGPWALWDEKADPFSLLEHLSVETGEMVFRIGVLEKNQKVVQLLRSLAGVEETDYTWFMMRGQSTRLGNHPALYAIGSGEKG